ncbi:MAG: hypothetical protein AAF657_33345 [Acidobacteriota bacterium]
MLHRPAGLQGGLRLPGLQGPTPRDPVALLAWAQQAAGVLADSEKRRGRPRKETPIDAYSDLVQRVLGEERPDSAQPEAAERKAGLPAVAEGAHESIVDIAPEREAVQAANERSTSAASGDPGDLEGCSRVGGGSPELEAEPSKIGNGLPELSDGPWKTENGSRELSGGAEKNRKGLARAAGSRSKNRKKAPQVEVLACKPRLCQQLRRSSAIGAGDAASSSASIRDGVARPPPGARSFVEHKPSGEDGGAAVVATVEGRPLGIELVPIIALLSVRGRGGALGF